MLALPAVARYSAYMPNKRQMGKRKVNAWVSVNTYAFFAAWAESQGVTMSAAITEFMEQKAALARANPEAAAAAEKRLKEGVKNDAAKKVLHVAGEVVAAAVGTYLGAATIGPVSAVMRPLNISDRQSRS